MLTKKMDKLSQTLSSLELYQIAMMTIKTINKDRNKDSFDMFFEGTKKLQEKLGTDEAACP